MRHKLSPHYHQNPCSRTNFFFRVKPISTSQPFDTFPIKICSEKILKLKCKCQVYVQKIKERSVFGQKSKYQYARISAAKLWGWGRAHQIGKERCTMVWGNEKGKRCFLSQYLRCITQEASSRHMITVFLAHEVTTMNKHEFTQFLPKTMILRKLQKVLFQNSRICKGL